MVDFNTTTYQGHGINGIRMIELLLARFIRLRLFPCSVGFIAARSEDDTCNQNYNYYSPATTKHQDAVHLI